MRKFPEAQKLLRDSNYSTKIYLYFGIPTYGDDYDSYEKNLTYTDLNPITIKAYVTEATPGSLVFKQIGMHQHGAVEIVTEKKYANWFENVTRIVIDSVDYQVYKHSGGKALIQQRPMNLVKITLTRK